MLDYVFLVYFSYITVASLKSGVVFRLLLNELANEERIFCLGSSQVLFFGHLCL